MYLLYISFPLNTDTMIAQTRTVEGIIGQTKYEAGAGMGMRDIDFVFDNKDECLAARRRFRESRFFRAHRCLVSIQRHRIEYAHH